MNTIINSYNNNDINDKINFINEFIKNFDENIDTNNYSDLLKLALYESYHKNYNKMHEYLMYDIEKNNNINSIIAIGFLSNDTDIKLKYLNIAANKYNCIISMNELATYYRKKGNYKDMEKYYLMILNNDNNHLGALYHLGLYYRDTDKSNKMLDCFTKCIELGLKYCGLILGDYYRTTNIDYNKMKKYYLIAISANYPQAMHYLGNHYKYNEIDEDLMLKFYLMAIDNHNYIESMEELADYYYKNNYIDEYNYLLNLINETKNNTKY